MNIYRLLDIKPNSGKMILLWIPPVYSLWLLAIGKRILQKQNKPDSIFTFFGIGTVVCWTLVFLTIPFSDFINKYINSETEIVLPIILTIYFFWFGTTGILTNLTIKYERLATPDRYYGLVDRFDYVKRFLAFFYWPFSIWVYQKKVNEYNS